MPDIIDQAQSLQETLLKRSLENRPAVQVPFSGACLSCEEPVDQARFCGPDCRKDWEARQKRKR